MEIPAGYERKFQKKKPGAPRGRREELIQSFMLPINEARKRDGFEPLSQPAMAKKLKHIEDLYPFYNECQRARSFSRFFWWALENKYARAEVSVVRQGS